MQSTYGDVNLDEDPVIIPACGHLMTLSSMDGHMGMNDYYEMSESSVTALKPMPQAFSQDAMRNCPLCRGPLRDLNRYNRIVRQLLIEKATKNFITWANSRFLPLQQRLSQCETQFHSETEDMEGLVRILASSDKIF